MYAPMLWTSLHNITKYVNHYWYIDFKTWRYINPREDVIYDFIAFKDDISIHHDVTITYGTRREKPCLRGFGNNNSADQPAHPRSLISAFVILFLKSVVSELAIGEISIF